MNFSAIPSRPLFPVQTSNSTLINISGAIGVTAPNREPSPTKILGICQSPPPRIARPGLDYRRIACPSYPSICFSDLVTFDWNTIQNIHRSSGGDAGVYFISNKENLLIAKNSDNIAAESLGFRLAQQFELTIPEWFVTDQKDTLFKTCLTHCSQAMSNQNQALSLLKTMSTLSKALYETINLSDVFKEKDNPKYYKTLLVHI